MPEAHQCTDVEQPGGHRRAEGAGVDATPLRRTTEQRDIADRFRGGDQQEALGVNGECADPGEIAPLDPAGHRPRVGQAEGVGGFRVPAVLGELQQGQRVAACLGEDPFADPFVHRVARHRIQQGAGIGVRQTCECQLGQVGEVVPSQGLPGGEHHRQRFGEHAPRHERHGLRGDLVEPLRIVHEAEQGLLGSRVGQEPEYGQADQEPVRRRSRAEPEGRGECFSLRGRKARGVFEERGAELVQPCVRQFHLRFGARSPGDAVARRACRQVVQEGGLPYPGLTAQDQDGASACLHGAGDCVERATLAPSAAQWPAAVVVRPEPPHAGSITTPWASGPATPDGGRGGVQGRCDAGRAPATPRPASAPQWTRICDSSSGRRQAVMSPVRKRTTHGVPLSSRPPGRCHTFVDRSVSRA